MAKQIIKLVFTSVALAMGVVSVVLSVMGVASVDTVITLLGIGLFAVAVAVLQKT